MLEFHYHLNLFTEGDQQSLLEVAFLVDGSGSLGPENFNTVKSWVKSVANRIRDGNDDTSFSVLQYSHAYPNV